MFQWIRTQIGDKPAWAIFAAAAIAAAGSALVAAGPGLFTRAWQIAAGGDNVGFLVREKETSRPLEGVRINILSLRTLKPVQIGPNGGAEIITQRNGLANARIDLASGDFTLEARYSTSGTSYVRTDPLLPKDNRLFTIDFTPGSWSKEGSTAQGISVSGTEAGQALSEIRGAPRWMEIAAREVGQREIAGPDDNPQVLAYLATINMESGGEQIPWNSAFVNWSLARAGVVGTNSGRARSWLTWGRQSSLVPGCIAVFWRQSPSSEMGHVGFFVRENAGMLEVLGGNQRDSVSLLRIDRSRLLDCRMPADAQSAG